MRRADRLFRIVQALRGGRLRTARQLAETLEVSERTIYRDIVDLQASGVPVEGASGYGYVMADGYEMGGLRPSKPPALKEGLDPWTCCFSCIPPDEP